MITQPLPDAPNGEYLPEPPDAKTVSWDGFPGTVRYDQLPINDGVKMLTAMGAVALQLDDDLKTKTAATDEAKAKIGIHIAMRFLPGIEFYRHIYKQHKGEPEFRLAECKGIEALEKKIGISPSTVRTWRQRYRHLPEYRAALEANGIAIEQKPERIKQCDNCGTRINLPDGEEPDHAENCPEHRMRREAMGVVRDLAIRGETYKRIACGEGKCAMLPEKSRIQKIQELALGTPVSDLAELDDFSVLLNRIRGQEMDEMLSMLKEYYSPQQEQLSIFGIELVIRENSGALDTPNKNGSIQSAITGVNSEKEAPNTEDCNATQEEERCVAEPVEVVSNATLDSPVALPDVNGIRNVTPAPAVTVMVEPENRNAAETTDVASPTITPFFGPVISLPEPQPEERKDAPVTLNSIADACSEEHAAEAADMLPTDAIESADTTQLDAHDARPAADISVKDSQDDNDDEEEEEGEEDEEEEEKPDCAGDSRSPCSSDDWTPCNGCHKMLCVVHGSSNTVEHPNSHDMLPTFLCDDCSAEAERRGDITLTDDGYEYLES